MSRLRYIIRSSRLTDCAAKSAFCDSDSLATANRCARSRQSRYSAFIWLSKKKKTQRGHCILDSYITPAPALFSLSAFTHHPSETQNFEITYNKLSKIILKLFNLGLAHTVRLTIILVVHAIVINDIGNHEFFYILLNFVSLTRWWPIQGLIQYSLGNLSKSVSFLSGHRSKYITVGTVSVVSTVQHRY